MTDVMDRRTVGPPPLERVTINRPRLVHAMSAADHRVVVLSAGPGYGKSSLLAEFGESCSGTVFHYRMDSLDGDLVWFVKHLTGAIRRCMPGFRQDARDSLDLELRSTRGGHAPEIFADALSDALARLDGPLTMILDDCHFVDGSERVLAFMRRLLDRAPPELRLVMASRGKLRLPLAKLRAYGQLCEIGNRDLAFTTEESHELLTRHCPSLTAETTALIHRKTVGWVAGLVMAAHAFRQPDSGVDLGTLKTLGGSARYIYDFLAEEVFAHQTPEVQDFLLKTGILETLRPDVCDALAGTRDSLAILEALERRGLFVLRSEKGTEFSYHPLLLQFLRDKLYASVRHEDAQKLHARAAEICEGCGYLSDAILHHHAAGLPMRAADLVETIGPQHLAAGFSDTVHHWIDGFPKEVLRCRPRLLLLLGRILHQRGDLEEALAALELAFRLFENAGDSQNLARAARELGLLHTRRGTNEQAIGMLQQVLDAPRLEPTARADVLRALAANLRETGQLDIAAARAEEALELVRRERTSSRQTNTMLRVARSLALIYMIPGRLKEAVQVLEDAVRNGGWADENDVELGWAWCNLGMAYCNAGSSDKALDAFQHAETLCGRRVAVQQQWIHLWRGCLHRDQGNFEAAEADLTAAGEKGVAELAMLRLFQGDGEQALLLARSALRAGIAETAVERARAEGTLGIVLAHQGLREAAERHLSVAEDVLKGSGGEFRLLGLQLHRAVLHLDHGNTADCDRILRHVFRQASAKGHRHFLWWSPAVMARLCARAFRQRIEPDFAFMLASTRLDATQAAFFRELVDDGSDGGSGGVRREALSLLQEIGNLDDACRVAAEQLLGNCKNNSIRRDLTGALASGLLPLKGFSTLRDQYDLTWREAQIFVVYYLEPTLRPGTNNGNLRKDCARKLFLSENTLRVHVKNLRRKLDLPWETGSASLREWLVHRGLASAR